MDHLEEFSLTPADKGREMVAKNREIEKERPSTSKGSSPTPCTTHKCRYCSTAFPTVFRREVHERIHKHLYEGYSLALAEKERELKDPEVDEEEFKECERYEEEEKSTRKRTTRIERKVLNCRYCLKTSPYSTLSESFLYK